MPPFLESLLPLYTYCEANAGLVSQPLNVLSCAVFLIGAVWMWRTRAEDDESPSFHQVSAILLLALGLSGMAWHVSGSPVAMALDMFLLFMLFIIMAVVVTNDILRWDLAQGLAAVITLIMISALLKDETLGRLPQNGGLFLPLLFFLAIAAIKVQTVNEEVTVYLLAAAYTLFFGLVARSADSLLCGYVPLGLHFVWHILLVVAVIYIGKTVVAMKAVPWPEEDETPEDDKPAEEEIEVTFS